MAPPEFLPSRDGFAFTNAWPAAPAVEIPTPFGTVGIGNAALGLCGGMVFAALDYWHARMRPPADRPEPGSPLYRYVVRRLVESWRLPAGVAQYYQWMNLPDGDGDGDGAKRRGTAGRTAADQWPRVKARLDRGIPVPLGLVTVAGPNPLRLGHNHQALAYGYTRSGDEVTLRVYDPNAGPDDGVGIRFGPSAPGREFAHNLDLARPVRGFFLVPYSPAAPP